MTLTETLLTAAVLSIDACVVALAFGLVRRRSRARDALLVGATFGILGGATTFAGAAAGGLASSAFARFDHWVAFAVLAALGAKSLFGARGSGDATARAADGFLSVAAAGIAVSIDTFAAGFGFELVHGRVAALAWSTGAITACGSLACYLGARRIGAGWRRAATVTGGLALLAIAFNVLREHADHL